MKFYLLVKNFLELFKMFKYCGNGGDVKTSVRWYVFLVRSILWSLREGVFFFLDYGVRRGLGRNYRMCWVGGGFV